MGKKKEKKIEEPQYYKSRINSTVLNYNVYVMKPAEKLLYSALLFVAGGVVGLIFYGGLFKDNPLIGMISNIVVFCIVGALAVKFFMPTVTDFLKNKRINTLKAQFREFLSSLTTSLSGGMNVLDAMNNAKVDMTAQFSEESFIVTEINEIVLGMNNNIPVEDMLKDFGDRSGVGDISNFATVFATCYRTGGNIKNIVRRTSEIISEKMSIAEEIETKLTSNKMQMMVMNVLPIVMVLIMKTMSSSFAESFASPIGVVVLTISVALFVGAYILGQKMTDIKG